MRSILTFLMLFSPLFATHLYIIHGREGVLKKETLQLRKIDHSVVYFSEGRERRAGTLSLPTFLERWSDEEEFGKKPPQAYFISYASEGPRFNEVPLTIAYPRYNAEDETLTFRIEAQEKKSMILGETALYLTHD